MNDNDNVPGEEFVKILHRSVTWYMFVAPKEWQILCHGFVERGALLDTVAEFVTCTHIIGPLEWELESTGRENPLLEYAKRSCLEAAAA